MGNGTRVQAPVAAIKSGTEDPQPVLCSGQDQGTRRLKESDLRSRFQGCIGRSCSLRFYRVGTWGRGQVWGETSSSVL